MTQVVPAEPKDADAIANLMDEMDLFYGADSPEPRAQRLQQINEFLFSSAAAPVVLLAWKDGSAAGMASCSLLWPAADTTRSLYLKELYVQKALRGQDVGSALMKGVIELAESLRCSRVEWTTDTDNEGAVKFYEKLDVAPYQGKIFYRKPLDQH